MIGKILTTVGLYAAWALAADESAKDSRVADAAQRGDRAGVARLLADRAHDPNAAQVDGTTALHWAAHQDDETLARQLIGSGANPRAANRYGVTPLSLACVNGSAPMVELLLKAGADPNAALPGGETALMTASRTGRIGAVRALIAAGADVKAKESKFGQSALIWAAAEGHAETVDALIAAGANPKERLESGFTPLLFAAREGKIAAVRALLNAGVDVNDTIQPAPAFNRRGKSPRTGTSALALAVANAHYELAAAMLDAGANPDADEPGWAPIHAVTWVRKPGLGDNDPAPDGSGNMSSLDFVRKLKSAGANLNARMSKKIGVGMTSLNTTGATAFLLAARTGDAELMRLLASLGADPLIPNADGATPLIAAAGLGTRSPGEDAGSEAEVVEAVKAALDLGNDIDAVDKNGETAMHGAAYKNLPKVVELLAARGAKIEIWNRKNRYGWTPLRIAEGYRFGNYKPSQVTIDAFHKIMTAAGVSTVTDPVPGRP